MPSFQIVEVKIDRIGGRTWTPTRAGVVGGGDTVPKIARYRVLVAERGAIATPRDVSETSFPVDEDDVFLGIELIAAIPSAMTGAQLS